MKKSLLTVSSRILRKINSQEHFFFQYDGNGLGKRNLQEKEFVLPVIHLKKNFFLLFLQYPSRIPCPKPNFIFHFVL